MLYRNYEVNTENFLSWEDTKDPGDSLLLCYTDGSRQHDRTGAGICIRDKHDTIGTLAFPMGVHSTVFQAEVDAIGQAAEMAEELITMEVLSYERLAIHVDSQACLLYTSPSPRDKRQSRMPSSA